MKFMKLGSKTDLFQSDGDTIRYVATELASDIVVNVGDVKFYLHKFPLLSKSARLQKRLSISNDENSDEIDVSDIPGGPAAFEICAKFCYGMIVTLNAYNVVAARCAADYLEMYESVDKGNLIYKVEVFLNSSIFRSWKDSIIVLQTTRSLFPWSEELKVVNHCLESISTKASIETSKVEWSYSYNRKKLASENGDDQHWNGVRKPQAVPKDWWVEDLCELHIDLYKRVITTINTKGRVPATIIGEALHAYALRRLPGFDKGMVPSPTSDVTKYKPLVETIIQLLPTEKYSIPCNFSVKLLKAAILLDCGEDERSELTRRIGQQLYEATVSDLLIRAPSGVKTVYDVEIVQILVEEFLSQDLKCQELEIEILESRSPKLTWDSSKVKVTKLIDGYLTEISRDPDLPVSNFVTLAEMVSSFSRPSHDGLYRAIDMFLKEHPGITKSEKKKLCRLMDCRKLSAEACSHAIQNERLPMRVVVQVLFFEQIRTSSATANNTPDRSNSNSTRTLIPGGSNTSSRTTTTNTEEDWDPLPTADDINAEKASKMKGIAMSKMFSKLWSSKERNGEISSSDNTTEETKSTLSTSRRS